MSGVGQHQMWASQYWRFTEPYTWVNSGGLGTMGFSIPAAIGAKVGRPDRTVWAIDGDGCFQMTAQELVTASVERIPIKVGLINNSYLGMVRQWQEMFYDERYSEVYLSPDTPDYVRWAEAMGCVGIRVEEPEEVEPAIEKANAINDRPVVVEFRVDSGEKVFPMVPAGHSNDDHRPARRPDVQKGRPAMRDRIEHTEHRRPRASVRRRVRPTRGIGERRYGGTGAAGEPGRPDSGGGEPGRAQPRMTADAQPPHPVRARPEPAGRAGAGLPACSPGGGSTSTRSPSRRPRTRA